jgi:hypothetical protein
MSLTLTLRRTLAGAGLATAALLGACGGESGGPSDPSPEPQPQIQGRAIFGLDCSNRLVLFGSGNPGTLARQVAITGMPQGAAMLGIDFRPGDGRLYGIGSDNRMYAVDTLTGAAAAVAGSFTPAASGEHFGLAFDGGTARLSGVESNQNQSFDPATGATVSAGPDLAFAAGDPNEGANPAVAALGSVANGGTGTVYGVESNANILVRVDPATGALHTVGDLGFNAYLCSGLDIDTDGTAYAAISTDSGSELYTLNLATGEGTLLGKIAGGAIHSIALKP